LEQFKTMILQGQRIVVTGGASGMGAAVVRDFVAHGAQVVAMDVNEAANVAAAAAAQGPGQVHPVTCDVSAEASVQAAFATASRLLGGLDSLVHAAGISPSSPGETTSLELWEQVMAINARGTFLTNVAAFDYLKDAGGRIVNFSSAAGLNGYPRKGAYAASKGAVLGWMRSVAVEWARYRITVNAIVPGIWTPMYEKTRSEMSPEELQAHDALLATLIPLGGKLGNPDRDLAPVLRFLVTKDAGFMTGQTFAIDGGMVMVR
jgi:NAD(P)-dependent dehydrogenase (short-subunit alcohol dehydrogenase family)